jgi:hypothetical protein
MRKNAAALPAATPGDVQGHRRVQTASVQPAKGRPTRAAAVSSGCVIHATPLPRRRQRQTGPPHDAGASLRDSRRQVHSSMEPGSATVPHPDPRATLAAARVVTITGRRCPVRQRRGE